MQPTKASIRAQLAQEIFALEGYKPSLHNCTLDRGVGAIRYAFPNNRFPLGVVHEFLLTGEEGKAATVGFVSVIVSNLLGRSGVAIWITSETNLLPPTLTAYGLTPEQIIFIELKKEKDILWAAQEALRCSALSSVIIDVNTLDFTTSRRLQLAVEKSKVTGFVLRSKRKCFDASSALARWLITPLASKAENSLPGVGHARWNVGLLRVRGGKPHAWQVTCKDGQLWQDQQVLRLPIEQKRKAV